MVLKNGGLHTVKSMRSSSKRSRSRMGWSSSSSASSASSSSRVTPLLLFFATSRMLIHLLLLPLLQLLCVLLLSAATTCSVVSSSLQQRSDAPPDSSSSALNRFLGDIGAKHIPLRMSRREQQSEYCRRPGSNVHAAHVFFLYLHAVLL